MRISSHRSGVTIGLAVRRSCGDLIERLTPAKAGSFGDMRLHPLYYHPGTLWKFYRLYHRLFLHPLNADAPWTAVNRFLR